MSKKFQVPSFYIDTGTTDTNVSDFDIFYKPKPVPQNPATKELVNSLSSIVPALINYQVTEDVKAKKEKEAEATVDFENNKKAFADLVKNGKIPPGANPHYFNKMMELQLNNEAREFEKEFGEFYATNNLDKNISSDAFSASYEDLMQKFINKKGLNRYDDKALKKAFFDRTTKFRESEEKKHNIRRFNAIQKNTEDNAIKNWAGFFIENQNQNSSMDDVLDGILKEATEFKATGNSNISTNNMFEKGIKAYINTINDPEGFAYAREIVNSFDNLKLGTGYFSGEKGSRKGNVLKQDLLITLTARETLINESKLKLEKSKDDTDRQKLADTYFEEINNENFTINNLLTSTDENGDDLYTQKQKNILLGLHNAVQKSVAVGVSNPQALKELELAQDTNPYAVKAMATKFLNEKEITITDFKLFYNTVGKQSIINNDTYFQLSIPFNSAQTLFRDKNLSAVPGMSVFLTAGRMSFEQRMINWHKANESKFEAGEEYQRAFNAQVKVLMAEILRDSPVYDSLIKQAKYRTVLERYGITFVPPNTGGGN